MSRNRLAADVGLSRRCRTVERFVQRALFWTLLWPVLLCGLIGCSKPPEVTPTVSPSPDVAPSPEVTAAPARPEPTVRPLPTLYPTASPAPTTEPTVTRTSPPTEVPDTPIAFDQVVATLHYAIPALDLDRRIEGNVSSRIKVVDETTGRSATRENQTGVLLELQQVLMGLELDELPEDCPLCVHFEYGLPLVERSGSGWLRDVQLLASVENYTSAALGPHYPPQTIVGLRRSATPYRVAHSIALTGAGRLWRWTATQSEVTDSEPVESAAPELAAELVALDPSGLGESYAAPCPEGSGIESLFVSGETEEKQILIICPELSLPTGLLTLYLQLDRLSAEMMAGQELPAPEPAIPLDSVLVYRRQDGAELTLFQDGRALVADGEAITVTATLSSTRVLSLTTGLLDSGLPRAGVDAFVGGEAANIVIIRGPEGVYELSWEEPTEPDLDEALADLESVFDTLLDLAGPAPTVSPSLEPTAASTAQPTATP